jgi:hypothetical protein
VQIALASGWKDCHIFSGSLDQQAIIECHLKATRAGLGNIDFFRWSLPILQMRGSFQYDRAILVMPMGIHMQKIGFPKKRTVFFYHLTRLIKKHGKLVVLTHWESSSFLENVEENTEAPQYWNLLRTINPVRFSLSFSLFLMYFLIRFIYMVVHYFCMSSDVLGLKFMLHYL